jgi:predicted ATPase
MITSVRLQDFKGHRDTQIPLGRFTVLVGPNGSGKTSVLEALWLQRELAQRHPAGVLSGDWSSADLQRRGATGPIVLTSEGTSNKTAWRCRIELPVPQRLPALDWRYGEAAQQIPQVSNTPLGHIVPQLDQVLGPTTVYKLDAARIAAAAYSDRPDADVEADGTNTAVALASIKLGYDEAFARIEEEMRRLIPNVERVRVRPAQVQRPSKETVVGSKIFFDFRGASGVPAHAASEGTLITLALLTILHGPNRPNILLLDDFDQSLHPHAQLGLVRLIKRLLHDLGDVQIVATTHSPYILDEIDASDVHAFALRDDGTVAVKRLSEHPQAEQMKGALSAGQLWSLDPEESWVLEKAS